MIQVNVRQARQRLSSLLDEAEKGRTVLITRRGRAVARLTPTPVPKGGRLPDMRDFRKSIAIKPGAPSGASLVRTSRDQERF